MQGIPDKSESCCAFIPSAYWKGAVEGAQAVQHTSVLL